MKKLVISATITPLALENMKRYSKYDFDSYVFMLPARTSALDPVKSILTVLDAAKERIEKALVDLKGELD